MFLCSIHLGCERFSGSHRLSGRPSVVILMGAAVLGAAWITGCSQQNQPAGTPIEQAWEAPPAPASDPTARPAHASDSTASPAASTLLAEAPTTRPEGSSSEPPPAEAILAVVNGKPLAREAIVGMLIESHGLSLLEHMILLTVAQERAARMGLTIGPGDVAAAHEEALRRISQPLSGEGVPLDRPTAERLLAEFLQAKNISRGEWELRMRQHAYLRKIAQAEVERTTLTEAMLREEYGLAYGERVQIRHIQVSSLAAVERVRSALQRRGDFAAVAREMSENQITGTNGGLLEPFTLNEGDVPPLIREAAFRMKPGEISAALQVENWYHIIKVERRFPASGVTFENVDRDALRNRLKDRLARERQETLEEELFRSASVDIRDETLRKQFREKYQKP